MPQPDIVYHRRKIFTTSDVFHSRGYSKPTVQDILDEIGLAKDSFCYYYKSKKEVMGAMLSREQELACRLSGLGF